MMNATSSPALGAGRFERRHLVRQDLHQEAHEIQHHGAALEI
jgi:hypothetical protein